MSKLIVFDWNKVLEGYNTESLNEEFFLHKVLIDCGWTLSSEDITKFTKTLKAASCICISQTSMNQLIETAFKEVDITPTPYTVSKFRKSFIKLSIEDACGNPKLINFIEKNKDEVDFALISNCNELELARQSINIPENLLVYALRSCEIGFKKPYYEIYKIFMERCGSRYKEILLVDDEEANHVIPHELGWKFFLYEGDDDALIEYLEDFIELDS